MKNKQTLQELFDEFKSTHEGSEAMCHLDCILHFHKKWNSFLEVEMTLYSENGSKSTIKEIQSFEQKKYEEWKEQENLFIETLNQNFDLSLIESINGNYTVFDFLSWNITYHDGDVKICYKPTGVAVSGFNASLSNIIMK